MQRELLQSTTIRSLWRLCYPIMIAEISTALMIYADRVILAQLNQDAMNAAASAGLFCLIFQIAAMGITSMAEVYVGRYVGGNRISETFQPVWQMLFFSAILILPFALMGHYLGDYVVAPTTIHYGLPYFRWIMTFCFIPAAVTAIAAFFIAQGITKIVTYSTILANLLNIILSISLVFGIEGWISPMGIEGAAIGTVLGQTLQLLILSYCVILHTKKYSISLLPKWDFPLLKEMILVGFPKSIAHLLEIIAWTALYYIAIETSREHASTMTIAQSIVMLFSFFTNGLSKGVTAQSSNLIGAKRQASITPLLHSAAKLMAVITFLIAIPLLIYPEIMLSQFFPETKTIEEAWLYDDAIITLRFLWIFYIFDSWSWIVIGALSSLKDTWFMMFVNVGLVWFIAFIPATYIILHTHATPSTIWAFNAFYGFLLAVAMTGRIIQWKKRGFMETSEMHD